MLANRASRFVAAALSPLVADTVAASMSRQRGPCGSARAVSVAGAPVEALAKEVRVAVVAGVFHQQMEHHGPAGEHTIGG